MKNSDVIDLKEVFGHKYRINEEKNLYDKERRAIKCSKCIHKFSIIQPETEFLHSESKLKFNLCPGFCRVSTTPQWFYSIPCKYGQVHPYGGSQLELYCTSRQIANRMICEIPELLVEYHIADDAVKIVFNIKNAKKIFKYIKPKTNRKLSPEHKRKLHYGLKRYNNKKRKNPP